MTASSPDVSLIVPVYNVGRYVRRCAASLKAQDFTGKLQLIFINDGSTDDSLAELEDALKDWPDAILIDRPNGGAASARNEGLEVATGTFVGFVDPDDYVTPNFVRSLYEAATCNGVDIAQADFTCVDVMGEVKASSEAPAIPAGHPHSVYTPGFGLLEYAPGIWRRLYRRSFLACHKISFHPGFTLFDDLAFFVLTVCNAESVAISRDNVYFYTVGRDGQHTTITDQRLFVYFDIFDYLNGHLETRLKSREFFMPYLRMMFRHLSYGYDSIHAAWKERFRSAAYAQLLSAPGPLDGDERLDLLTRAFPAAQDWLVPLARNATAQRSRTKSVVSVLKRPFLRA